MADNVARLIDHYTETLSRNISARWLKGTQICAVSVRLNADGLRRREAAERREAEEIAREEAIEQYEAKFGPIVWDRTVITVAHSTGRLEFEVAVAPEGS
jgi:hypothetical protein